MFKKVVILFLAGLLLSGCGESSRKENSTGQLFGVADNVDENIESPTEENQTDTEETYIFEFTDAVTTAGDTISSDIFADSKVTMVNVWATFCGPCINEMPDLAEVSATYDKADFQMLGIVSDVVEDDADMLAEALEIIEETGADYPHLLLNEELYVNLVCASDSVPTSYFFNQEGEILGYLVGANSKEVWEEVIDGLLEEME